MYCNKFSCVEVDSDNCDGFCYYCDYSSCEHCEDSGVCIDEVE